jgi:nucleoside-diphosphate-sugar epimerase
MIKLMSRNFFNERFIVSSENLTYRQLFTLIAKYLDKPAPSVNVPPALTRIAWRVDSFRSFLTGSKPEVTREMATTAAQVYTYSNEKIRRKLSMEFLPIDQSVREICEFFLKDLRSG